MRARGAPEGELLTMSGKERERLVVIRAVGEHRLRQSKAAKRWGLSVRQVKRLVAAFRCQGAKGLVSKRAGEPATDA